MNGFHVIQSLTPIVWVTQAATFQNHTDPLNAVVNYQEVDHPPSRDAPQGNRTFHWFQESDPTVRVVSEVVAGVPDGGGTGKGTATFHFHNDGTTVTVIGTLVSAGFPGPYFISQGQVQTKTVAASFFFHTPGFLAFNWTMVNFGTGFIAQMDVVFRGY